MVTLGWFVLGKLYMVRLCVAVDSMLSKSQIVELAKRKRTRIDRDINMDRFVFKKSGSQDPTLITWSLLYVL